MPKKKGKKKRKTPTMRAADPTMSQKILRTMGFTPAGYQGSRTTPVQRVRQKLVGDVEQYPVEAKTLHARREAERMRKEVKRRKAARKKKTAKK